MAQPASRLDLSRVVQCVLSPLDLNILTHTVRSWGKDSPNRCAPSLDRPLCVTDLLIVKNLKTKCEGLSPALFLFSIAGNVTYVLSILVASMDLDHIAANAGWIAGEHSCPAAITSDVNCSAGSSLTVFLDVFVSLPQPCLGIHAHLVADQVLGQFFYYQTSNRSRTLATGP